MTPEEFIAEAKRRGMPKDETLRKYKELKASGAFDSAPPAQEEQSALDKVRGAIQSFNQGATLGWSDEIVGGGRALLESILPETEADRLAREIEGETGDEQSFADRYRMYRDEERDVQGQFERENEGTALALSLAGGITSPLNYVGPGLQAAKGASALRAAGTVGARGAAEGTLAGAGSADEVSDIPSDAAFGGVTGGIMGGTMGGLGRAISSRKVAQELGRGEDFTPLNMIETETPMEETVASAYRDVVGRIPGLKGVLVRQQKAAVDSAEEAAQAGHAAIRAKKEGIQYGEDALKQEANRSLKRSMQKIDDEIAEAQAAMRAQQAAKALPDYVPDGFKADVASDGDPRSVVAKLGAFWGKDGDAFSEVKSRAFEVDQSLANMLKKHFPDGIDGVDDIDDLVGEQISGEWLMRLRNDPAMAANVKGDSGLASFQRYNLRRDVADFDKQIERLLGETNAVNRYRADLGAYGDYQAYLKAVDLADANDGLFTGAHLAKAGPKRARRTGNAPGQELGAPVRRLEKAAAKRKKDAAARTSELKQSPERKRRVREELDVLSDQNKAISDRLSDIKSRAVSERVTFPSQVATALTLAGIGGFGGAAAIPAVVAGGRALVSQPGQRFVAGQTGWQKALQDNDTARMMSQLLRQGVIRETVTKEEEE